MTLMAQVVEINLRLPNLRMKTPGADDRTIVNADVRFTKEVELQAIPKPGEVLTMSAIGGGEFPCEVVQANWHHEKNLFVVACRYGKRSVSPEDYLAISNAPDWATKALL
jgi:hypothetical protein